MQESPPIPRVLPLILFAFVALLVILAVTVALLVSQRNETRRANAALDQANVSLAGERAGLAQAQTALKQAQAHGLKLTEEVVALEREQAMLTTSLATHRRKITSLESYVGPLEEAETKVAALESEVTDLEAQLVAAREEHRELLQERGRVEQQIAHFSAILEPIKTRWVKGIRATDTTCETDSMAPTLNCGDRAFIYPPLPDTPLEVGHIIAFPGTACQAHWTGFNVAHRITDVRIVDGMPEYWTAGDNNPAPDGCWVRHDAVIGYVAGIYREGR